MLTKSRKIIIMGDFIIDLLNNLTHVDAKTNDFVEGILSQGLMGGSNI